MHNIISDERVGQAILESQGYRDGQEERRVRSGGWIMLIIIVMLIAVLLAGCDVVYAYTIHDLADAIYLAEGGANTSHPYGILKHYKTTTPRQACLNTIKSAKRRYEKSNLRIDFVEFLGSTYCPVGAANDPRGLNKNWVKDVRYFLAKHS